MVKADKIPNEELVRLYRMMFLIRRFEEKAAEMYARGKITGFTHLYIGEEAVAVGAISALHERDYVVSTYRDHGHCLAGQVFHSAHKFAVIPGKNKPGGTRVILCKQQKLLTLGSSHNC